MAFTQGNDYFLNLLSNKKNTKDKVHLREREAMVYIYFCILLALFAGFFTAKRYEKYKSHDDKYKL